MAFQDDLRRYLERLLNEGLETPQSWFEPDLRVHRQHLLRELERLEAAGVDPRSLARLHKRWSYRVDWFATQLGASLVNGLAHRAPPADVSDLINVALSRRLGSELDASTGSFIKDVELDRLSQEIDASDHMMVPQYALEIRATRLSGQRRQLTPLGRVALELPERDVVRWLLTAEAVQSRGPLDEWRLSRTAAAELRRRPRDHREPQEMRSFPAIWATMRRLSRMGVLTLAEDVRDHETGGPLGDSYEVSPSAFPLLDELASGQETHFSVLISALLSDETSATVAPVLPPTARQATQGAALATTRHARMVAHEIRNALVPVQGALDALYRDAERRGNESVVERHRDAIDQGIERVFSFIKDMMEVAERGAEPPGTFGVAAAIEDAIAAVTSELGGNVTFEPARALPLLTGHRNRFTLAVVNLVRNALQTAAAGPVKVRISAEVGDLGAEVLVLVEDSGPGVPVEHRSAIFDQGFSLRPGGTGQGLALVREVVESEMGGRATCEDSPLGGARFVLRVPVTERTAG